MGFLVQSESPVGAPGKFRPDAINVPMFRSSGGPGTL